MALDIDKVTAGIAALNVTGITIKDMSEIPAAIAERDLPMLVPDLANYVSDFRAEWIAGDGTGASWDVRYTLNYMLVSSQAGATRATVHERFAAMMAQAMDVVEAVMLASVDWAVEVSPRAVTRAGTATWGKATFDVVNISLDVLEFVN